MTSNEEDLRRALHSAYEFGPDFPHPGLLARISADLKSGAKPGGQLSWIAGAVSAALAVVMVVAFIGFQRSANLTPHQSGVSPAPQAASPTPSAVRSPSSPLAISSVAFRDAEVGVTYGPVTLSAVGGVPPYTWSVVLGNLPGGLTLDPNGIVSGTPTSAGVANFTVQVADSANVTVSAPESMQTAPALTVGYLPACAGGNCVAETGCAPGVCGQFGYVTGGSPPYSFSVTAGTLPPGPALTGLVLVGPFDGTGGTFNFEVTVTDGLGGKATLNPTFRVAARLWMSGGTCTGDYNAGCSVRIDYTGGIGTPRAGASVWMCDYGCTAANPLPPGFTVVVAGGAVTVTFPKGMVNGWKGIVYVQIADAYTSTAMSPAQVNVEVRPKAAS
ncbi:MAG TPA: Ig domain-containing protein [Candidatus Dormibacteraeota bacterium]|nr:Ig domain-containing protein [Candidatus Dormibacteraeota bacterium]